MSRLVVVTRPSLVPGFQLAGVEVYGAEDFETAQELIGGWLEAGEAALLAVDDGLLENMELAFLKRLSASDTLLHLAIPGGQPLGRAFSRKDRIAQTIRRAIGFHITFKGEEPEEQEP